MRTLTRELLDEIQRVLTPTQEECLQTKRRQPMEPIPVIITCIPYANSLQKLRNEVGTFVNQKIFNKSPLVKIRRPKGLRYRLVSTKFRNSKLKDGELLPEFHLLSDHQTKIAPRAEQCFNGKI